MLSVGHYPKEYVDGCRAKIDAQIAAYREVTTVAKDLDPAGKTIKMDPATSVLGYGVGDTISLNDEDFERLSKGFFAEIESKFR